MEAQMYEILRPLARMVAEELADIQRREALRTAEPHAPARQFRGIQGIMDIFHCSRSMANKIKGSGVIDEAITRVSSKLFLVDEQKALKAMEKKKGGRRY